MPASLRRPGAGTTNSPGDASPSAAEGRPPPSSPSTRSAVQAARTIGRADNAALSFRRMKKKKINLQAQIKKLNDCAHLKIPPSNCILGRGEARRASVSLNAEGDGHVISPYLFLNEPSCHHCDCAVIGNNVRARGGLIFKIMMYPRHFIGYKKSCHLRKIIKN